MPKLDLSLLQKPQRESRTFECETSAGAFTITLRKIGILDTVNWTSCGDDLHAELSANPVLLHDEVVLASKLTCKVATALVIGQVAGPSECYTERELIALMTEDDFAAMATEAFEWLQEESEDAKKKPAHQPTSEIQ
ncbi:MAG: hypothetical protein E6R03_00230 [Hyphomicrobiaceae bacterium]|nr:MAG: hypothetical protein E6R03_00230 [Hyphomicrobiaceae bacterium]